MQASSTTNLGCIVILFLGIALWGAGSRSSSVVLGQPMPPLVSTPTETDGERASGIQFASYRDESADITPAEAWLGVDFKFSSQENSHRSTEMIRYIF